jgi:hypothetical protein
MSPWHGVYRVALGFSLIPAFAWWRGDGGPEWHLVPFVLVVLLALRLVPAIVRHVLPFPEDLQTYWLRQRLVAKRFDSYQWRKLLWLGLGVGAYLGFVGRAGGVDALVAVGCLLAGGLGGLRWRRLARAGTSAAVITVEARGDHVSQSE